MADAEKSPGKYSECPKCRKHGYYKARGYYTCRYCGYTAPDVKDRQEFNRPMNKLNHGTKPGGLRY